MTYSQYIYTYTNKNIAVTYISIYELQDNAITELLYNSKSYVIVNGEQNN